MEIYRIGEIIDKEKVGNKASSLSFMKNKGFNVPDGIVIGNDIFLQTVSKNKNECKVHLLLKFLSKENASDTSKKILSLYEKLSLT